MRWILPLLLYSAGLSGGAPTVRLVSNLPSPQPVGTVVGLFSQARDDSRATMAFRYSVSVDGGEFHIVRDFSQDAGFRWRPELYEHEAHVRVTFRNNDTKQTADAELPFRITSRVTGTQTLATPTANPLVALFSAPACPEGSQLRVVFRRRGDSESSRTSPEPCRGSRSSNVYVAGMRPDSVYEMQAEVLTGGAAQPGPYTTFHTGLLDGGFPPVSLTVPPSEKTSAAERFLLFSMTEPFRPMATDLEGHVVWYLSGSGSFLTRNLGGGRLLMLADGANSANDIRRWQLIREVDLAGNIVRETNVSRVAEQLEAHGIKSSCKDGGEQCVPGFHHEVIRLPNGHFLAIGSLERFFPAGTQGAKERVDILGDLIFELDADLQLTWFWNAFDHLDIKRAALNPESKCKKGPGEDGCPPVFLAPSAHDWMHSNSLNYTPDSNLLLSIAEQDWVVKIDYQNGKGTGKVLWRLGKDGDFTAKSSDPYPWFSYQHDAGFEPRGSNLISLLDDGHLRKQKYPQANNRAQVWQLDEKARTATPVINADMGLYSMAVGAVNKLKNGNMHGLAGLVNPGPALFSRSVEVSPEGKVVYALQMDGALAYRSFRIVDLYTPPDK